MNRYQSYIITGSDWVPEIPEHWSLTRSKFIFRNKSVKNCPDEPLLSVTQKNGVVLRSESDLNVWNPTEDVSGYKLIEPSNFVISLRSFEGGLELSKIKGIVSPAYTVLEKTRKINAPYFRWLMKSHQFIIELNKHVTGIRQGKNIGWDDFSNIYLTVPPIDEQKLISRYLDKKTSQVDSLVEKIQKKIELLKEQRTSLINHYVTKGLDPNVEMKDSGIEWIGEIPKHWEVTRLKYHGEVLIGLSFDKDDMVDEGQGTLVLRSSNVQNGQVNFSDNVWVKTDVPEKLFVQEGDILICSRNGSRNLIGKNCLLGEESLGMTWGVFMSVFRSRYSDFFFWILNSQVFTSQSGLFLTSTINQLTVSTLENLVFPFVSDTNEQNKIDDLLKKETKSIDELIEKEQRRISLLKEYRQSLISSAVTGKVKISEDMI